MHFEGDDIVHFPITASRLIEDEVVGKPSTKEFVKKVDAFRQQLKEWGAETRQPVPSGYTPHISVLTKGKWGHDAKLKKIVDQSKKLPFIHFHAGYPTLYAKYKGLGYRTLTDDPNKYL